MTLKMFEGLLKTVCVDVQHFISRNKGFPRIIYTETGRNYEKYENKVFGKSWTVEVHFFTKTDFDPIVEALEDMFNDNDIPFELMGIQYGSVPGDGKVPGQDGVIYYMFECEVQDG
jgi:hypothetical protein